jgi:hypothetical protein
MTMQSRLILVVLAAAAPTLLACGGGNTTPNDGGSDATNGDGNGGNDGGDAAMGNDGGDGAATCFIGLPCSTSGADPACNSNNNPRAICNDQTNDGFPGGYCSQEPCSTVAVCPDCATCAHLGGEANACWKACSTDGDCRTPDYGCFDMTPLIATGSSSKVCYLKTFACILNTDCPTIRPTCSGADGGPGVCQ